MAFLDVHMVQVREIIRRWQAGDSNKAIGRASGVSARTVGRYLEAATAAGLKWDGEPPSEEVFAQLLRRNHPDPLPGAQTASAARPAGREEQLACWLQEERLQLTRVHELLIREGVTISYTSLRRYAREAGLWKPLTTTVRMADWSSRSEWATQKAAPVWHCAFHFLSVSPLPGSRRLPQPNYVSALGRDRGRRR